MFSKFLSIFSFSNLTLLVALTLSTIAAWYSIVGLTAIFAAAVVPIIIMGSALELAKIVTTVWLRKYWRRCTWIMKLYLVPAVIALALLTSMGIFGFLSKAHLDQAVPSGDIAAKVSLLDEKIKTERDNIEAAKKALTQMDAQVDQMLGRTDTDRGAERAVQIRKQQAKERTSLQNDIAKSQAIITKLNEERTPIASELRKVEAEVGPIKYIAAFIYGDNPDQNILERAVRWVIILLVIVFDPLAIMLVIAANQSKDWDDEVISKEPEPIVISKDTTIEEKIIDSTPIEIVPPPESEPKAVWEFPTEPIPEPTNFYKANIFVEPDPKNLVSSIEEIKPDAWVADVGEKPTQEELKAIEEIVDDTPPYEGVRDLKTGKWIQTGPALVDPVVKSSFGYKDLGGGYLEFEGKKMSSHVLKEKRPDLFGIKEDNPREVKIDFGQGTFTIGQIGDTYIRTDSIPHRVFKSNGEKWIEINKNTTSSYLSNNNYLLYLLEKIATGEYDPELLTEAEQEAISNHLKSS